ncbi:MAG TPA: glycosyltransferase, partial [Candidatus Tumulicola sp.]|nr:glycosyltransferase [Candidatus Tumulicola sp.]
LHNGKYWGRIAALAARVPIVVFTEHSPQGEARSFPEMLVDEVINRITDAVITFTDQQRSMLRAKERIPSAKLAVIENGIALPDPPDECRRNDARGRLRLEGREFAVAIVGRLAPVKNTQLGIRALAALPASIRDDVRLCVIGDGSESESLHELARSLGVEERVTFFGHRGDAKQLLYGADVLFIPSLVEGMPLAGLEAMTVGLPVISTPWPGSRELFSARGTGLVLADWQPHTAAAALQYVARNPADLRRMGECALRFARTRYDIRRAAREHEQLYAELARRKGLR